MRYRKIIKYLMKKIDEGNIKSGERMPSIRNLCDRFECSKSTAVRAYYELRDTGIVYAVPGSGYYLIGKAERNQSNNTIIDLSGTELDKDSLPYDDFQSCLNQAINKYKGELFAYTNPQGLRSLISILEKQLQKSQVFSKKENIFITTGSQQALNILGRMPFPNGKRDVLLEQPTYQGMIQSLTVNNIRQLGVRRNFAGLDMDGLEKAFKNDNVKFFYTVPRFSNPLGLNYTKEEKKRLVYLAGKYDVYIVEDDFLGDFEYDTKSDPIYSYDTNGRVIYVKTFSKLLLPGLRTALVVIPDLLINNFKKYKYWSDLSTPLLSQGALEVYISSGLFDIHIKKIREIYLKRMSCLRDETINNETPFIKWHIPKKGVFYAGFEISNSKKAKSVIEALSEKNIILSGTDKYYLKEFYNEKVLRVSIANVGFHQIKEAVPIIRSAICD